MAAREAEDRTTVVTEVVSRPEEHLVSSIVAMQASKP